MVDCRGLMWYDFIDLYDLVHCARHQGNLNWLASRLGQRTIASQAQQKQQQQLKELEQQEDKYSSSKSYKRPPVPFPDYLKRCEYY